MAARHVDAFAAQLNWPATQSRYQRAVTAAAGDIGASHQEDAQQAAQISDARRASADATAAQVIQGTRWQDRTRIDGAGTLPADRACGAHRARAECMYLLHI